MHSEGAGEQIFLRNRIAQISSSESASRVDGDMLIVSQIRLADIGREAGRRVGLLPCDTQPAAALGSDSDTRDLQLLSILTDLNADLDSWYREWIWAGMYPSQGAGYSAALLRRSLTARGTSRWFTGVILGDC